MHATTPTLPPVAEPPTEALCNATLSSPAKTSRSVPSADLFKGHTSVLIEHNGASYRLQSTRSGKLILTK
jgi:hemin uptake protein HemP